MPSAATALNNEHRRTRTRTMLFAACLVELLQQFRGGSVTSWGRSSKHNQAAGGIPNSQHLRFTAADVVWDLGERPAFRRFQLVAKDLGLEVIREEDHDHLELVPALDRS